MRIGGVDAAEIALDDTVIVVGNGQRPMQLRRVEVEVRPEWLTPLEPLVEQLRSSCGLRPADLSKFEAGLLALGEEIPGSPDLGPTTIDVDAPWATSPSRCCAGSWPSSATRSRGRAWARTPRSCTTCAWPRADCAPRLALFSGVLPVRAQSFREELGWLGRLLGAVRDLDVQLEGLADAATAVAGWNADPRPGDHDPLGGSWPFAPRARHCEGRHVDRARLHPLGTPRPRPGGHGRSRARRVARWRRGAGRIGIPGLVVERHAAVAKAAKRAKKSGVVADFHRLRIHCKCLRYALEFSAEVYGGRTTRFVRQLTALQDELGHMQDAEVASMRLVDLARGATPLPPATVFVMGGLAERHRRDVDRLLRRLPKELARVNGREWRDLVDVMERRQGEAEPPGRRCTTPARRPGHARSARPDPPTPRSRPPLSPLPSLLRLAHHTGDTGLPHRPGPPAPRAARTQRSGAAALTPGGMTLVLAHHEAWVLGEHEVQAVGVEELLDVGPDVGEIGFLHMGAVGVHVLEPLHRHTVETGIGVTVVVVERAGVLLVAQHVLTTLAPAMSGPCTSRQCAWNSAGVSPSLRRRSTST